MKKEIIKDLQSIFHECISELKALGIAVNDETSLELICKTERIQDPVYLHFFDDRAELTVSEKLLSFPLDIVKAEIIGSILSIDNGRQIYGKGWLEKAAKVQRAYGYDMLNELDEDNLNGLPVIGILRCKKCGSRYELRGTENYNDYLDHGCTKKQCRHCGSHMWPDMHAPADGEPDLQALLEERMLLIDKKRSKVHNLNKLLKQCISELEAIEIYAGKIVNIIYVFLGKDYGECIPIDDDKYEIQIPYEYRKNTTDEKRLKALIIHQILHTCTESGKHNRQWMVYAREIEEAYGYEILRDCPFDPLNMWKVESVYKGTCPNCGCRVEIKGERNLAYILNHHKRFCSFCSADLEIMENVDAATRMRLNPI